MILAVQLYTEASFEVKDKLYQNWYLLKNSTIIFLSKAQRTSQTSIKTPSHKLDL